MDARELNLRGTITEEELKEFIIREYSEDLNKFLVINGGTGLRKTNGIMVAAKSIIEKIVKHPIKMVLVESRTLTVEQIKNRYVKQIDTFGGIDVKQRIAFANAIKNGEVENYDWVIIDECHGLFSEASFAEDAGYIANWIRCGRTHQHIIFITANDEFFLQAGEYYYGESEFSQLFKDMKFYFSPTYVEYAHYIVTNKTKQRLLSLLNSLKGKKGIVFLQHATAAFEWYTQFLNQGIEAAFIVSLGNETTTSLSKAQEALFQKYNIDCSGGQNNWTLAQIEQIIDSNRIMRGRKPVRATLVQEAKIPEDIEVVFATDTLQEGLSITSHLDYIIIEGYTEVEVRQKLGRYRNNLKDLYVIFNPSQITKEFDLEEAKFKLYFQMQENGQQNELAEAYGSMRANKWEINYISKIIQNGQPYYCVNEAAYHSFLIKKEHYQSLDSGKDYIRLLLNPYVKNPKKDILALEAKDFKKMDEQTALQAIVLKWAGVPFVGHLLEELFEELEEYEITDSKNGKIDTIRKLTNMLRNNNVPLNKKRITQKTIKKYPELKDSLGDWYTYIDT